MPAPDLSGVGSYNCINFIISLKAWIHVRNN